MIRATLEQIPSGRAGLDVKLARIRQYVEDAKRNPNFRHAVAMAVRHLAPHDHNGELRAVVNFVRNRVRYVHDQWSPGGFEFFQRPELLLAQALRDEASGDCDDMVILGSAMLETIGFPTRYRVGSSEPGVFRHIWLEAKAPSGQWLPIELTYRNLPTVWDPAPKFPGGVDTFEGVAMATNQIVVRPGGRPSMIVPTRHRAGRYAAPRYRGLLPSDLRRLRRIAQSDAEVAALEGWFSDLGHKLSSFGKKIEGAARPYLPMLSQAAAVIPGIGPVVSMGMQTFMRAREMAQQARAQLPQIPDLPQVPEVRWPPQMPQTFPMLQPLPGYDPRMQWIPNYEPTRGVLRYPTLTMRREGGMFDPRAMRETPMYAPSPVRVGMERTRGYGAGFSLFGLGELGYGELTENDAARAWLKAQPKAELWRSWGNVEGWNEWNGYAAKVGLDAEAKRQLKDALAISLATAYQRFGWAARYPKTGGWEWVSRDWGNTSRAVGSWYPYLAWTVEAHPEHLQRFDPSFRGRLVALHQALRDYWVASWAAAVASVKQRKEAAENKKRQAARIDELRKAFDRAYGAFWDNGGSLSKLNAMATIAVELDELLGGHAFRDRVEDLHRDWKTKDDEERQRKADEARQRAEQERRNREAEARQRQRMEDERRRRQQQLPGPYEPKPGSYGPPAPGPAPAAGGISPALLIGGGILALYLLKRR